MLTFWRPDFLGGSWVSDNAVNPYVDVIFPFVNKKYLDNVP